MNKNAIVRIVIWSLVILVLIGILLAGLGGFARRHLVISETAETDISQMVEISGDSASVTAEGIRDIEIDWAAGTITIAPGDVEEITVSESAVSDEKYQMVSKQSGDKLTIQFCRETVSFGMHLNESIKKDLVITVPQDWQGER